MYTREYQFCDEIPFLIYHKGITPEVIDVNGRNSLNMASTLLDYLDISAPNLFLGTSLFSPEAGSNLEYSYTETYEYLNTTNAQISKKEEPELSEFRALLEEYFGLKNMAAPEKTSE